MLTKDNFKLYVGYQDCKAGPANGYLLSMNMYTPTDWTKDIQKMTNDEALDRMIGDELWSKPKMSLEIMKYPVACTMTLEEVLEVGSTLLKSFPSFISTLSPPFYLNSAKSRIAFNSRRGAGNVQIENVVLYKGTTDFDCCLAIVHCDGKYSIIKQYNFDRYGLVLDGTKI